MNWCTDVRSIACSRIETAGRQGQQHGRLAGCRAPAAASSRSIYFSHNTCTKAGRSGGTTSTKVDRRNRLPSNYPPLSPPHAFPHALLYALPHAPVHTSLSSPNEHPLRRHYFHESTPSDNIRRFRISGMYHLPQLSSPLLVKSEPVPVFKD